MRKTFFIVAMLKPFKNDPEILYDKFWKGKGMRKNYFFAVKIPEEQKERLHRFIAEKKHFYLFKNWVHPQDYHITLAFLGKIDNELLQKAISRVNKRLFRENSFPLTIRHLGIFGSNTAPRVFWADVYPSAELTAIHRKVFQACEQAGVKLDKRPFRPHITLARKWIGDGPFSQQLLIPVRPSDNGMAISFIVQEIVLYETNLQSTPKYKEIKSFSLL